MKEDPAAQNGKTAINRVYHQLRTKILKCELSPGEKLKIESLKTLLNIGASPIREALSLLTSDGLVDRIDQRGFRVSLLSESNFNEVLMLRCELDVLALRKSIELGDSNWEEQLVILHHRLSRANIDDFESWESQHKAFHMALIGECQSPILLGYSEQLYDQNIRYRFLAEKTIDYKKRNISDEHTQILNATIERNADKAATLLVNHYNSTGGFLSKLLEKNNLNL
ncbi:GntR family transcriptional regulator [Alginatibacterium sediminis]|uniref:GntR family transcriptional regulator n=1 Tax=Alginatibacterium sediminis TaxID=2164068 RepID=A0A420E8P4_9ALTE|nr:GntR family transcriptional regulator [Alginatibacterium sediminis]RKF14563.1 GntR family transcriptional regulator [Alginatibacterium sediminis]